MNTNLKRFVITATLVATASTGAAFAATASGSAPHQAGPSSRSYTPNDCIRINGGDYNACNVGNSGRGDLPYVTSTAP